MRFTAHIDTRAAYLRDIARRAEFVEAANSPNYAYSRYRDGATHIYHYDPKSPTGVTNAIGYWSPEGPAWAISVLDAAARPFPLSPTEGLNKSGAVAYC